MTAPAEWRCPLAGLGAGQTARFRLAAGGRTIDGFVVNHGGQFFAYVNRCPHAGTPLDLWPNEFLDEEGRFLVCATHGACFVPDTGICAVGPCAGDRLTPLPVVRRADELVVEWPAGDGWGPRRLPPGTQRARPPARSASTTNW
jgi:nitrite reductase/ring-hydroxylating ferredoxin subunit